MISATLFPSLLSIIDEGWAEPVDRIDSAQFDDEDNIIAIAYSGDVPLAVKITDEDVEVKSIDATTQFSEQPDPIDPILAQLKPIGDATFTEWFITLQGMMNESDNLVEFRDKLTEAYPTLDAAEFKSAMIDSSIIAGMSGYLAASTDVNT